MPKNHLEKVLAHAERELSQQGKERPSEKLDLYKKFLKLEEHRLQIEHNAGGGGLVIVRKRAALIDIILHHIFDAACHSCDYANDKIGARLSLLAIGGYGRKELNPFSDVDIMFLHDCKGSTLPDTINEVIEQTLYMLWDVGFKVGHSTRSLTTAIKQANEDPLSKTALLEARRVAGNKPLDKEFKTAFDEKCVKGHIKEYVSWRVESERERHRKYGDTLFVQEPDIKNGLGGLRDYQNLLWITYFKEGITSTTKLVERKLLTPSERKELRKAYNFLLRVRTELHLLYKRPTDVLTLYFQGQIANAWQYPQKNVIRRSEQFMRDYYSHARSIYLITRTVFERLALISRQEKPKPKLFNFLAKRQKEKEEFDGFYVEGGMLCYANKEIFQADPQRIMRAFLHAQNRNIDFSPSLRQFVKRRAKIIDRTLQYSSEARATFHTILSRKGQVGRILRLMHDLDVLGRYMPEFGELTCLVQHEFYHRYTADEHTIKVIEQLDLLIDTEEKKFHSYRVLFEKLEDPYTLYLAILLHDTGRAANARHHEDASTLNAQRVARRHHLTREQRRELIVLVDNHTKLSNTAQRRNLDDPATIEEFANIIVDTTNLDALMLLTLADGQGTTDQQTWSDWKESLVWQLYRATQGYLKEGKDFHTTRKIDREELRGEVTRKLSSTYHEEIEAHFSSMPDVYFQIYNCKEILIHLRMFRKFLTLLAKDDPTLTLNPQIKWIHHPARGHSEVLICSWDREGLLERIACSFAIAGLNILSADVYTRADDLVLDGFRVCNTDFSAVTHEHDTTLVDITLAESMLNPDFSFAPLLEAASRRTSYHLSDEAEFPTRITIDNDTHPSYTLVDVQAPDRLGLLYALLKAFTKADVNIVLSRISTEKGGVIDSFYITDLNGRKIIDDRKIEALQQSITAASIAEFSASD